MVKGLTLCTGIVLALLCAVAVWTCRPTNTASDEVDVEGKALPPLFAAAKRGDASKLKQLLAAGADPNATDPQGGTALQYAASSGNIAVVQRLLNAGANVRAKDHRGSTALHAAAVDREISLAELLLAAGADVNARTNNNVTPLMASIGSPYSDAKMSLMLIRSGADINITDSDGESALWLAATAGPDQVFEELLKRGANPNIRAKALGFPGYTPLHMAAYSGSTKKVELLLQYGGDPAIRNDEGQTPLDITNVKFEEVRKLLTRRSTDGH